LNIAKKQLIPAIAAIFALAGCGTAAASGAAGSTGRTTTAAAVSAADHTKQRPARLDGAPAGALPFPIGKGYTWKYRSTSTLGGDNSTSASTIKILSVTPSAQGSLVKEYMTESPSKYDAAFTWVFHSNGTISYPVTEGIAGLKVTHSSGGILFPTAAELASGKAYTSSISLTVVDSGVTVTESGHVTIAGAGTQTVTVPAGTYRNATVLKMVMDVTADKIPFDITIKYWLAQGTGEVKSEIFFGSSTPSSTGVLLSFIK